GKTGETLDHEFAGEACVPACSASNDADFVESAELLFREAQVAEIDFAGVARDAAEKGVANGARLFEDFLLHEMLVAALFRHDGIPGDVMRLTFDGSAVVVHDADAGLREDGDIAVGEEKDVARVLKESGNVARDEEFIFTEANNSGRAHAGSDDLVRVARGHENKGINPAELIEGFADSVFERDTALGIFFYQMRDNFRVGFGNELVACALELFFQLQIIFDDAVVNDDDLTGAIPVRVGVFFRRTAVSGPAGMADSVGSFKRGFLNDFFEIAEFAGSAAD